MDGQSLPFRGCVYSCLLCTVQSNLYLIFVVRRSFAITPRIGPLKNFSLYGILIFHIPTATVVVYKNFPLYGILIFHIPTAMWMVNLYHFADVCNHAHMYCTIQLFAVRRSFAITPKIGPLENFLLYSILIFHIPTAMYPRIAWSGLHLCTPCISCMSVTPPPTLMMSDTNKLYVIHVHYYSTCALMKKPSSLHL